MKDRPVRHWLEYQLYRLGKRMIVRLPHGSLRRLGRGLGRLFARFDRVHRRRALDNLAATLPELGAARHAEITRRCFEAYGSTFLEVVYAGGWDPAEFQKKFDIEGWEHVEAALKLDKGCLFVAGHYGTWELALYPLAHRLGRVHIVARPLDNPRVGRDVDRIRARIGLTLLPRVGAGHAMLRVLRRRGNIGIVIDQRVPPWNGILIPFLGRPAWTTSVVAYLSILTGAPAVPVFCVPEGDSRYRMTVLPAILPVGRGIEAAAAMTRRYLEVIEREIRRRPERWLWLHRRWRLAQGTHDADRRARNRRLSRLPAGEAGEALEPPAQLSSRTFLDRGENVVIVGEENASRRAAVALGHALVDGGNSALFTTPREIARELLASRRDSELARKYRELDVFDLLILDGIERDPLDGQEADEFARLLEQRDGRRSILITAGTAPVLGERIDALVRRVARGAVRVEL